MRFPALVTLFAFAIRLWRLDAQSLRGDEAFDVLFAKQPLAEIIYQLRFNQIYPPLYHTLDHFWLLAAGTSPWSARFLALGAGVLLVPVVYRLAQRLTSEQGARLAAALAAIHPFLIWHAQDGRMYALLATLVALMVWLGVRAWSRPRESHATVDYLAYVLVASLALLTHYFAFVAWGALNLAAAWVWWREGRPSRFAARWLGANAIVGGIGASWIALAWARFSVHTTDWIPPTSPLDVLTRSAVAWALGTTVDWTVALPFAVLVLALAGIGAWMHTGGETRNGTSSLSPVLFLILVPLVFVYLGSLWRPMYDEKFLIFVVPFYLLLVARGLVALRRWQWLGAAAVALGMGVSLWGYQFDPQFAKSPPWHAAAQSILSQARAGDVVVYNFPDPSLLYQIGDALPVVLLPAEAAYESSGAAAQSAGDTERALQDLSARYERIWFLPQAAPNWDKDAVVGRWLGRFADEDWQATFGSLTVQRYLTPLSYRRLWTPLSADFAGGISLLAYRVAPSAQTVQLNLYWQANAAPAVDYTVFVHLLDDGGVLRAQQDNPPVHGTYPTSAWAPGQIVVDRYDIIIPGGLAAGHYRFEVGLYDAAGVRLRVGGDDKVIFGDLLK